MKSINRYLNLLLTVPLIMLLAMNLWTEFFPELNSKLVFISTFIFSLSFQIFVWKRLGFKPKSKNDYFLTFCFGGSIFFTIGFFGPLTLWEGGNQGPALGILITGPIGLIIGGLMGYMMGEKNIQPKS